MPDESRREVSRVTSRLRAVVTLEGGHPQDAECENLSLLGVLLRTRAAVLPRGAACTVRLTLDGGVRDVTLSGMVVRETPNGGAIRFDAVIGTEGLEHLRNLVLYNSHEPARAVAEFRAHLGLRKDP